MQLLLERMAKIERMERGKLCPMGGRPHYNHQTWENGRNIVRYVPADQKDYVQSAIDGYAQFKRLAEAYADEVIAHTRKEKAQQFRRLKAKPKKQRPTR